MKKFLFISFLILPLFSQAKCFESKDEVIIYSVQKMNSFQDKKIKEENYSFCLNNDESKGTLSRSDSTYEKIGNNTYIAYNENDVVTNIETIQIDKNNKIIKYSKNLIVNPQHPYNSLSGIVIHTWKYK